MQDPRKKEREIATWEADLRRREEVFRYLCFFFLYLFYVRLIRDYLDA